MNVLRRPTRWLWSTEVEIIDKVGSFAGLIAFLGTAFLAFLYFSQARDVRRLREWAGRAPERAAQAGQHVSTDPEVVDLETEEEEELPEESIEEQTQEVRVAAPTMPPSPPMPLSLDEVRQRREEARRRWRWLSEPRYAALLIGGVLIFATAAIAAVVVVTGSDSVSVTSSKSFDSHRNATPVEPSEVTVAVLNGTGIPGLAQRVGEDLRAVDFKVRTITNASQQGLKRTSVLYTRGNKMKAKAVAKQLRTGAPRAADPQNATLGAGADVIVTVGSDRASAGSSSSGATSGTTSPSAPQTPTPTVTPPAQ